MTRAACSFIASVLCALAASAAAQPAERVVLLAPPEVRAEWTAALQVELAARGALAIAADGPDAPTALLGDAAAQRRAIEHGASAAVWAEPRPVGWRLRMLSPSAERARVVAIAHDDDARTVALIIVSLLDGAVAPPAQAVEPVPVEAPAATNPAIDAAPAPSEARSTAAEALADPTSEVEPAETPRDEPYVHWAGLVGASGFPREEGAFSIRAGIVMRYDSFEAAVLSDLGLFYDRLFGSFLPFVRACVEAGAATSREPPAFHAGVRVCAGGIYRSELQHDGLMTELRAHLSGGAYAAVSVPLASWIRLYVRGDLDLGTTDLFFIDVFEVLPAISIILSFE